METSIPYDPTLVLGSAIKIDKINNLKKISDLKTPIHVARNSLNSMINLRKSLEMTMIELMDLNVDVSQINSEIIKLEEQIAEEAKKYLLIKIENEKKITELESSISTIEQHIESPIDFEKTTIKHLPLASDSLKLEVQYFSFSESKYDADKNLESMRKIISSSTSILGLDRSLEATASAMNQATTQMLHYEVQGIILITASCTHKNVSLMSPLILDPDKCIAIWNETYPDEQINTYDIPELNKSLEILKNQKQNSTISLLSGASCGSSLIGMVHITRSNEPKSVTSMDNKALSDIQNAVITNNFISDLSGDLTNNKILMDNVSNILSHNNISSHVTITAIGSIPKITSNLTENISKNFSKTANDLAIANLFLMQDAENNKNSLSSSAENTKRKKYIFSIESEKLKNATSALSEIDLIQNKNIDINSLMRTLDNFIENTNKVNTGVPINFYVTKIDKIQIIKNWLNKYNSELIYSKEKDIIKTQDANKTKTLATSS